MRLLIIFTVNTISLSTTDYNKPLFEKPVIFSGINFTIIALPLSFMALLIHYLLFIAAILLLICITFFIQLRGFHLYSDRIEITYKFRPKFLFKTTIYIVPLKDIMWFRYVSGSRNRQEHINIVLKDRELNKDYWDWRYYVEIGFDDLRTVHNLTRAYHFPVVNGWGDPISL